VYVKEKVHGKFTNYPLVILKERFAKGELSEEEYEQKKEILLK